MMNKKMYAWLGQKKKAQALIFSFSKIKKLNLLVHTAELINV